jgi:phosphosulfolactate synthase (CoM biosynthesis protein A)
MPELDVKDFIDLLKVNPRLPKPRNKALTEIRGPYYTVLGKNQLMDVIGAAAAHIDSLKFAGGSFAVIPRDLLSEIIDIAHGNQILISTGGFIEYVLTQGSDAVKAYIQYCKAVGFDVVEVSSGFISLPTDDWLRIIECIHQSGLKAKPEVGIQFGAGGGSSTEVLRKAGNHDVEFVIRQAKRFIEAGVYQIMIESEGITENTHPWRTEIPAMFIDEISAEKLMFEAADPAVFDWYIRNFGCDVNLFVDHSQIIQLECLRRGIWGTSDTWGKIQSFK